MNNEKKLIEKALRSITLFNFYKKLRFHYKKIKFILLAHGSFQVVFAYLIFIFKNNSYEKVYEREKHSFIARISNLKLSNDWFSWNIPYWLSVIDDLSLKEKNWKYLK